jgi:hypothetical protein
MSVSGKRVPLLLIVSVLIAAMLLPLFRPHKVGATQITNRTLTLIGGTHDGTDTDTVNDGGSQPGGLVDDRFTFTLPNAGAGNVLSIKFEYCTIASVNACALPTGISTTAATLGDEQGATGWTVDNTNQGAPFVHRASGAVAVNTAVTIQLNSITNPTAPNSTFFVRISTYSVADPNTGSPTPVDTGSVAASTSTQIVLTGTMPESLIFCTGATISATSGIPDCTTATAGNVTFNQLFSPSDTASASSQLAASTNALSGYNITVDGPTLTSGSNTIPAIASASASLKGTGQFGMNLRLNTSAAAPGFNPLYISPTLSADIAPVSNAGDLRAKPTADYNTADTFMFPAGGSVAQSNDGGTLGPTNSQIYTANYIVNVTGAQPAGTYSTTLTYICTATF